MVPIGRWPLLAGLLPLLAACSLTQVREQAEQIEAIGRIEGRVVVESGKKGTPIAVLYMADGPGYRLIGFDAVSADGGYSFTALPGRYFIAAFVDANSDLEYQPDEPAAILGTPDAIDISSTTLRSRSRSASCVSAATRLPPICSATLLPPPDSTAVLNNLRLKTGTA